MEDSRRKLFRKKGYKPFWETDEEEEEKLVEPVEPEEEEDDKKFKLVKGLMNRGLGSVIKRKKNE